MRRVVRILGVLLLLVASSASSSLGQEATPASTDSILATLGYPQLDITITSEAYQVVQTDVPAGLVLLAVTNQSGVEAAATILAPPEGMDQAGFQATVEATPQTADEFPAFLYQARLPGGPVVPPGQVGYAVVEVAAGEWTILGEGDQTPAFFTATEPSGAPSEEPDADLTIEMREFAFTGLPEAIPSGRQVWQIANTGEQPHMLMATAVPDGVSLDQILASIDTAATPGARAIEFGETVGLEIASPGQTAWLEVNLQPGTYVVACYVADPESGMLHVAMGMAALVVAGDDAGPATPVAPAATAEAMAATVDIADFMFTPGELEIEVGTSVTWTNQDQSDHTVTAEDDTFNSRILNQGDSFDQRFDDAGSYPYICALHPFMKGSIVVS